VRQLNPSEKMRWTEGWGERILVTMDPRLREPSEATSGPATDLVRLLRHFGVRALALAFVSCLAGLTTVALGLTVAGLVLLYAPVRTR
jgi:hypothetical protein